MLRLWLCLGLPLLLIVLLPLPLGAELMLDAWGAEPLPGSWLPSTLLQEPPLGRAAVQLVELEPHLELMSPPPDEEWMEGETVTIRWVTQGPITTVRLFAYGGITRLGGQFRGNFTVTITDRVPNRGFHQWQVPWIDAGSLMLRLAGYGADGKLLAETERAVRFRPRQLAGLQGTYLAVSRARQRLYYYESNRLRWISIVSTGSAGRATPQMRPGSSGRRGAMGQVFSKSPNAFSRMYQVNMPWWMAVTSSGSHGIHATSARYYRRLGSPASAGCVRQHTSDARRLYDMVKIGTAVYVF